MAKDENWIKQAKTLLDEAEALKGKVVRLNSALDEAGSVEDEDVDNASYDAMRAAGVLTQELASLLGALKRIPDEGLT